MARVSAIHVYFIDVDVPAGVIRALANTLTDRERARAEAFRFDDDQRRSIVARAATRLLLARRLAVPAASLEIIDGEHGKPALRNGEMDFNASHSGRLVTVAITNGDPVGVDIEARRRLRDPARLAHRFFSPAEIAIIDSAADREQAFLTIWTAKEAIVKATGRGIAASDLRSFSVPFAPLRLSPVFDKWSVATLAAPLPGYYAALACDDDRSVIRTITLDATGLL